MVPGWMIGATFILLLKLATKQARIGRKGNGKKRKKKKKRKRKGTKERKKRMEGDGLWRAKSGLMDNVP